MKIFGFDTETSLFEYNRSPDLFQWVLTSDNETYVGSTSSEFRDLIQNLYDNMRDDIVVVAHNLPFDYYMVMLFHTLKLQQGRSYKIRTLSKPSLAYFSKKVYYWEYPDEHAKNGFSRVYYKRLIPKGVKTRRKTKTFRLNFTDLSNYFLGFPKLEEVAVSFGLKGKFNPQTMFNFNLQHFLINSVSDNYDYMDDYLKAYTDMYEYCLHDAFLVKEVLRMILNDNPVDIGFRFTGNSLGFTILKELSGWRTFDRPPFVKQKEDRKSVV